MHRTLAAALILVAIATLDAHSASRPEILHTWAVEPRLIVCADAPGGFQRWYRAARHTEAVGARWHSVIPSECPGDMPMLPGDVLVTELPGWMPAGMTGYAPTRPGEAGDGGVRENGVVLLARGWENSHVPEHELLHIQGVPHRETPGNVMHPRADLGGHDYTGVRRALRAVWR